MAITIPRRFNGPPDSANGGYACGVVAAELESRCAHVSLRSPPPLDVSLRAERDPAGALQLFDGDTLVAEGRPAELAIQPPPPPTFEAAEAAMAGYAGFENHMFPTCFVCGPQRRHDGLRIFPGRVGEAGLIASTWAPEGDGPVDPRIVWAALDCPTAFACTFGGLSVLAALTARLEREVRAGERYVVTAWPLGRDGRKHRAGAAVHAQDGTTMAVAEGLWIEVKDPGAFAPVA